MIVHQHFDAHAYDHPSTDSDSILSLSKVHRLASSSVETNISGNASGNPVNGSYTRFYAYGSLRVGDPTTLSTDRTFTGQKADGTGLLYYNARYYDPALGTFLSPDTLVPDAGRVIDYNRFLYVRGNPLSYSDPSGHCATTTNGQPDMDGDTECWQMAYGIAGLGYTEQGFWDDWGGQNRSEWWLNNIANQSFADLGYLTPFFERYSQEYRGRTGLNQPFSLEPVVNPELHMPGDAILKTVVGDVVRCSHDLMDCSNALDDGALVVASGAVIACAGVTGGGCLAAWGGASAVLGGSGAILTTRNAVVGEATVVDAAVSWGTTIVGYRFGHKMRGLVGAGISAAQRWYDSWSDSR